MSTQDSLLLVATSWPTDPDTAENEPNGWLPADVTTGSLIAGDELHRHAGVVIFKDGWCVINAEVALFEHRGEIHITLRRRLGQDDALKRCMDRAMAFLAQTAHPHDREDLGVKVMPVAGLPATSWINSDCYAGTIKRVMRNGRTLVWVSEAGREETFTLRADGQYRRKGRDHGSLCLGDSRKTDLCREL